MNRLAMRASVSNDTRLAIAPAAKYNTSAASAASTIRLTAIARKSLSGWLAPTLMPSGIFGFSNCTSGSVRSLSAIVQRGSGGAATIAVP